MLISELKHCNGCTSAFVGIRTFHVNESKKGGERQERVFSQDARE
jgi:hypothetical protein